MAEIIKINDNTYRFEDSGVRFFLLIGKKSALLVDTGMNSPDARALAETVTDLPLTLLNTHADPDHVSGNAAFGEFYMSPNESDYFASRGGKGRILPVREGDTLDLGDRLLRIIDLPGHTPGSIAVLDTSSGALISGDPIQDGNIFMFGPGRDLAAYADSLDRLMNDYSASIKTVYPSHGTFPVSPDIIPALASAARSILDGTAEGTPTDFRGKQITVFKTAPATFLCN